MSKLFGKTQNGEEVHVFELVNANGMKAEVIDFGAILKSLFIPGKDGKPVDVVLGYDTVAEYEANGCFFGAVIAPSANRIGKAAFSIDGKDYQLDVNDGPNNLHSHYGKASHKRIWKVEKETKISVSMSLKIADMDMGFPGNKEFTLTYTLTDANEIVLEYGAKSDKNTIINPTNHSYFNLSGHSCGKQITDNKLTLNASCYTPVVEGAIPTGEIAKVEGTVMDFTKGRVIGQNINDNFEQLLLTQGYDHNFVIDNYDGTYKKIAKVEDPASGRSMEVYTDLPGVQFYAGNCISPQTGKDGAKYGKRTGLCLETQYFPDTIHHANFPSCVFGPGKDYSSKTAYKFFF